MPEPDDEGAGQQQQPKGGPALEGLVVGSYCHDVLLRGGRVVGETLGGAAAFVSNVLDAASPPDASFSVVSKVGPDFAYASAPAPARRARAAQTPAAGRRAGRAGLTPPPPPAGAP